MLAFMEEEQFGYEDVKDFYIHTNTPITSKMSAKDYYIAISKHINHFYGKNYIVNDNYDTIKVEFYGFSQKNVQKTLMSPLNLGKRFYYTSIKPSIDVEKIKLANLKKKHITHLENSGLNKRTVLCALDVETAKISGDLQYPIAISFAFFHYKVKSFMVTINKNKLLNPSTSIEAINDM